ncbi:MAG: hypothetical protein E6J41_29025 [Chloroflexi bacterium]|nr:MAG: hypothetical protein E6J41_29025 [Chloroflexota bacterium]
MSEAAPRRHRIGLEIEVEPEQVLVEPGEWDLDELDAALRDGVARPVRVIRGRVTDDQHDAMSTTLSEWAEDVDAVLRLHWLVSDSPHALLQPAEGAPRPSLETLVELQALAAHLRRLSDRLRGERL